MGNQLQKQYNIKQKPLKLPGSYNFLKFIQHPQEDSSLIIIKNPHKATAMPSTIFLSIKEIKPLSYSNDLVAVCEKCLPLAILKPRSEEEMKIIMYKILRSSTEIGRCFWQKGRVVFWCEEKKGISSMSPEEFDQDKITSKSRVFISGISLINFLFSVYDSQRGVPKKSSKTLTLQPKANIKQQPQLLPLSISIFFDPKDKKEYFDDLCTMKQRLLKTKFWTLISQGLRQLLLNMVNIDPGKRIQLSAILCISYFIDSIQLKLYNVLSEQVQDFSQKQAKIFMKTLEIIIIQGCTIQKVLMEHYFIPVLTSIIKLLSTQSKRKDFLTALATSILIQCQNPSIDIICIAFRKIQQKNLGVIRLALQKKQKLRNILPDEQFESIISRAIFSRY